MTLRKIINGDQSGLTSHFKGSDPFAIFRRLVWPTPITASDLFLLSLNSSYRDLFYSISSVIIKILVCL